MPCFLVSGSFVACNGFLVEFKFGVLRALVRVVIVGMSLRGADLSKTVGLRLNLRCNLSLQRTRLKPKCF
eukprot:2413596-Amphidinium_carterae.1